MKSQVGEQTVAQLVPEMYNLSKYADRTRTLLLQALSTIQVRHKFKGAFQIIGMTLSTKEYLFLF